MSMFIFQDQERFMKACGQTIKEFNLEQLEMYFGLVHEEMDVELCEAMEELRNRIHRSDPMPVEVVRKLADALLDSIVVCTGALISMGLNPQPLWNTVARSNDLKKDPITGRVLKREDGKILKPAGWVAPDEEQDEIILRQLEGKLCLKP
jgi:predicted HAD superfamily Cof-like phosphohydrolase